ncbi:hypothetical protein JRO89_XS03G0034100 [Xanthoceras sorbifolium]|uniref:Cytochrome c oxidase assembly factor 3 mitochondrial coiled-coil domain-containing protein n=1 Tax=Xanthoceras sorbifolium TaxID=99658 RepID=A0ABQ8I8G5_9ROSI|nr:hypothetical protein JRO89_XS03G0034100 [Xanthoceras sorbifolium]
MFQLALYFQTKKVRLNVRDYQFPPTSSGKKNEAGTGSRSKLGREWGNHPYTAPALLALLYKTPLLRFWLHKMAGLSGFSSLAPKTKNLVVAGGLTSFVFGVYFYTMRAVGGTDELQQAIDKFEGQKN